VEADHIMAQQLEDQITPGGEDEQPVSDVASSAHGDSEAEANDEINGKNGFCSANEEEPEMVDQSEEGE